MHQRPHSLYHSISLLSRDEIHLVNHQHICEGDLPRRLVDGALGPGLVQPWQDVLRVDDRDDGVEANRRFELLVEP